MNKFRNLFDEDKAIIAMLHLGHDLDETKREIDIFLQNNIDAVIVENYYGDYIKVVEALEYLDNESLDIRYGVNYLGNFVDSFVLAHKYHADFVQIDSISGHLTKEESVEFYKKIEELRNDYEIPLIGGVRFKYQPVNSGNSVSVDLGIATEKCEGIVVTGSGTGLETPLDKLKSFREILNGFNSEEPTPLIVGAGMTLGNCEDNLKYADAAIVGSYLKDNGVVFNKVSPERTEELMTKIKEIRQKR